MKIIQTIIAEEDAGGARLSDYLVGKSVHLPSRKSVKKAIDRGCVRVEGQISDTGRRIQPGYCIDILSPDLPSPRVLPLNIPVVYEDDTLAVVNKPSGIPVSGNQFRTVQQALPHNLQPSPLPDALRTPQPVHRLDAPTSGLLLVAKTAAAAVQLGQLFEQRAIQKTYEAIVIGTLPEEGKFTTPVQATTAITHFFRKEVSPSLRNSTLSWVVLQPLTGRTHQLRIHLAEAGHPIMGDNLYGNPGEIYKGKGLFLCATALSWTHPFTGENIHIRIDPPNKFPLLMARERRRSEGKQFGRDGQ